MRYVVSTTWVDPKMKIDKHGNAKRQILIKKYPATHLRIMRNLTHENAFLTQRRCVKLPKSLRQPQKWNKMRNAKIFHVASNLRQLEIKRSKTRIDKGSVKILRKADESVI